MVTHKGTKTIETERLLLRPFTVEDAPAMFRNWACDPEVTKHLTWQPYQTAADAEQTLQSWSECYSDPTFYQWAIVLKGQSPDPIGSISVVDRNEQVDSAVIGYCIGQRWWRQGITSEALQAVIQFLFDEVGMNRIESYHDVRNPNSGAVMVKCGMQYEGTHRQAARSNQGLGDIRRYAILAGDRR